MQSLKHGGILLQFVVSCVEHWFHMADNSYKYGDERHQLKKQDTQFEEETAKKIKVSTNMKTR